MPVLAEEAERTGHQRQRGRAFWLVGLLCLLTLLIAGLVGWACFRPVELQLGSYYLVLGRPDKVDVCLVQHWTRDDLVAAEGRYQGVPDREGLLLAWLCE